MKVVNFSSWLLHSWASSEGELTSGYWFLSFPRPLTNTFCFSCKLHNTKVFSMQWKCWSMPIASKDKSVFYIIVWKCSESHQNYRNEIQFKVQCLGIHAWVPNHKSKSKEMITIKIRMVVTFEGREQLQLGWGTWRGFWVAGEVQNFDLGGGY